MQHKFTLLSCLFNIVNIDANTTPDVDLPNRQECSIILLFQYF